MSCKKIIAYKCTVGGRDHCEFYRGGDEYPHLCDCYDIASMDCHNKAARDMSHTEHEIRAEGPPEPKNPGCGRCKYVYTPAFKTCSSLDLQGVLCTYPDHTGYDCYAGEQKHYRSILEFNADGECKRFEGVGE